MMDDTELWAQSEVVISARVRGAIDVPRAIGRSTNETLYEVTPSQVFKGHLDSPVQLVAVVGFRGDQEALVIPGSPHMRTDDEVVLFLRRGADGLWRPTQLGFGVFYKRQSKSLGDVYVRTVDELAANTSAKRVNNKFAGLRRAGGFEAWLLAGGHGEVASYLVSSSPQKFLVNTWDSTSNPDLTPDNEPIRWFEFDSSTTLDWYAVAGGQAGASYDEFAAVEDALAAWVDVLGSDIFLNYAGTVANANTNSSSGPEVVIWDDPNDQISGSWNGSGTLAIGGTYFSLGLQNFDGQDYHPNVRGYVVTQDGAASYFNGDSGRNGAEVLTHEIGHTLSFSHPCSDSDCTSDEQNATMRATAHADGRGASLEVDDMNGAAFLYPGAITQGTITVSPASVTVSEPSGSANITVNLSSAATADVSIPLSSLDTSECEPGDNTVIVQSGNSSGSFTVNAVEDGVLDGDQACSIQTGVASSSDPVFDGVPVADISVTVQDDGQQSLIFADSFED